MRWQAFTFTIGFWLRLPLGYTRRAAFCDKGACRLAMPPGESAYRPQMFDGGNNG